jgi:hypothetical protein
MSELFTSKSSQKKVKFSFGITKTLESKIEGVKQQLEIVDPDSMLDLDSILEGYLEGVISKAEKEIKKMKKPAPEADQVKED